MAKDTNKPAETEQQPPAAPPATPPEAPKPAEPTKAAPVAEVKVVGFTVKEPFSAFGKDYGVGSTVTFDEAATWPEGAAQRRQDNGFMAVKV